MKRVLSLFLLLFLIISMKSNGQLLMQLKEESVSIEIKTGKLHGKLLLPSRVTECPVALIISGSGPTDMDGNSAIGQMKNNSLKYLAEGLANQQIASLRFDKRGIASSRFAGMKEQDLRFEDYVNDVKSWIDYLVSVRKFKNVYVIGHSEGSLIGMLACQGNPKVKAFISVAGAGRPMDQIIEEQVASQPESVRKEVALINAALRKGETVPNVSVMMQSLFRSSVLPYVISCYKYDPKKVIATLRVPILLIQGTTDIQISVRDAELLKQGQPKAELQIIENMNHVMKDCPSKEPQKQQVTYINPSLPLNKKLLNVIGSFIKR